MEWNRKDWLNTWLDEKLIQVYNNPSKVEPARALLHRWMPVDEQECKKITESIFSYVLERNRYKKWARDSKLFYPELPNLLSFFRDQGWRDPLPARSDFKPDTGKRNVTFCLCGKPSTQTENLCSRCWTNKYSLTGPTSLPMLRTRWKEIRLKKDGGSYQAACMKFMTGRFHLLPDWMKSETMTPSDSTNSSPISKPISAVDEF